MYEERKTFGIKDIIIQVLFVALFVFVMLWLFPSKKDLEDKFVTMDDITSSLRVLYGQAFANNVNSMREAATGYFTTERLPKNVGDSVTLTLGEMLEKKLVLEMKDSNNNACSLTESYVKLTKMDNEYQMKIQLSCSDYSDYIISYIGCYEYCKDCTKDNNKTTPTKPSTTKPTTKPSTKPEPAPTPTPDPTPVTKKYIYEYRKTWQNEWSNWSNWSDWSTSKVKSDRYTQVEIKTENVITGYNKVKKLTGYKEVITYEDKIVEGTKTEKVKDVKDAVKTSTSGYYTDWTYSGTVRVTNSFKYSTTTTKYTLVNSYDHLDCNNVCQTVTERVYDVYTRSYVQGGYSYSCASYPGYTKEGTKCVKVIEKNVPTQTVEKVEVKKQEPIYEYVNGDPIYKSVTKYRYRTRTLVKEAGSDVKWSKSANDTDLINNKYVPTGNYKEA